MQSSAANFPLLDKQSNTENFFSHLMCDWFNPQQKCYNLQDLLNPHIFLKLFEIADEETYATVCLRIIYQYFYESDAKSDDCKTFELFCIADVMNLTNQNFRVELLKLMVAHWKTFSSLKDYDEVKEEILSLSDLDSSNRSFFDMAFMLHENQVNKFELELVKILDNAKEMYGDFKEDAITPNIQLLLVIMKRGNLVKTFDFTLPMCPFLNYNSTILGFMKRIEKYQRFIVESNKNHGFLVCFWFVLNTFHNIFRIFFMYVFGSYEIRPILFIAKFFDVYTQKKLLRHPCRNLSFLQKPGKTDRNYFLQNLIRSY